jgi:hypothetical protein
VQTQWTVEEGGNDRWYTGTVTKVHADGRCAIKCEQRPPAALPYCPAALAALLRNTYPIGRNAALPSVARHALADDDGDKWTGDARYIMRVTDGAAPAVTTATVVEVVQQPGPVLTAVVAAPAQTNPPVSYAGAAAMSR